MSKYIVEPATDSLISSIQHIIGLNNHVFEDIFEKYGEQFFLAGGLFKDIFRNKSVKDIDLYFYEEETFNNVLNIIRELAKNEEIIELYNNDNAVCFDIGGLLVDLVHKKFQTVEETLDSFDFTVTKMALFKKNGKFFTTKHNKFDEHFSQNILQFDEGYVIEDDYCPIERVLRYSGYKFNPTTDTIMKTLESLKDEELSKYSTEEIFHKVCSYYEETLSVNDDNQKIITMFNESVAEIKSSAKYVKNDTMKILVRRELHQHMYGYKEIAEKCSKELQKFVENDKTLQVYSIKETITILNFLNKVNEQYSYEQVALLLHFLAVPTRFVNLNVGFPVILECCNNASKNLEYYHPNPHYSKDTNKNSSSFKKKTHHKDLHEAPVISVNNNRSYNRDNEAEILLLMLEKFDFSEVVWCFEVMFSYENVKSLPTFTQWKTFIEEGIFTPDMDFGLFLDLVSDEIEV